jgi:hypothetical protein
MPRGMGTRAGVPNVPLNGIPRQLTQLPPASQREADEEDVIVKSVSAAFGSE